MRNTYFNFFGLCDGFTHHFLAYTFFLGYHRNTANHVFHFFDLVAYLLFASTHFFHHDRDTTFHLFVLVGSNRLGARYLTTALSDNMTTMKKGVQSKYKQENNKAATRQTKICVNQKRTDISQK